MRAAARDRRDGRLGAAGGGGKKDNRIGPRACEQDRGDIGYQPCSRFQAAGPARFELGATPTFPTLSSTRNASATQPSVESPPLPRLRY